LPQPKVSPAGFALILAMSVAAACSETLPVELGASSAAPRLEVRPSNTTCLADTLPLGRVRLKPAYKGFVNPLRMVDRPDRGLLYVGEMAGRIRAIDKATGQITTALDIIGASVVQLLGIAIHATKPYAYVTIERGTDATTKKDLPFRGEIVRYTTHDGGKTFDPASAMVVIRIDRPFPLHPTGTVEFGPDGYLYIGAGESGRPYTTSELIGSILRIDVDGAEPYAIPPDNPHVTDGGRPEIWAGGFRNPWRFTFDRGTGALWEGDVGQDSFEEINLVERGKNYGWPTVEGNTCFTPRTGCDQTGLTAPVLAYPHSEGGSITGGYVYRGKLLPDLVGKYIYADFTVGHVRMLEGSGATAKAVFLNPGGPKPLISSFGEDADGELYAIGWDDGILYRLEPGEADNRPVFPARLSQTGCVDPANPTNVAAGLVPYGVNTELWSDGAEKRRWVGLPDGAKIHVEDSGDFTLPERTVVVKEFAIDGRRIETRLLRHHLGGGWSGATYEWNDEQNDALLLENAKEKVLPGGQKWVFPSSVQCFVCHKPVTGTTLGMESLQLNGDFAYTRGQNVNQLTLLSDIGYLDRRLDAATLPRLPKLQGSAPIEDRARAYLHTNCSFCHQPEGGTGAPMDFRWGQPRAGLSICAPSSGFPGVDNVKIITPGDPSRSAVFRRMTSRDYFPMPPLATKKVDDVAAGVLDSWIRSLKTCE
jgi:uncharacterized repeat protein (TIGR03806 family)